MAIRGGTLRLGRQLRAKVGAEADAATRALTASWIKAWDALAKDMDAAVADTVDAAVKLGRWPTSYELRRIVRVRAALLNAQDALVELGTRAGVTITDASGRAISTTAGGEPDLIASQLPATERAAASLRFAARILPSALDVIVARTGHQIASSTKPLSAEAVDAMNRELVRGIVLGSNPRQAGAEMLAGLQDGFNGGLARAVTIARTEILTAYRETSRYAHMANADVLRGWIWLCHMGSRTCPSCIAMNGTEHAVTEPGPQDHQSGRCSRMPWVKSWADLGIKAPEPPSSIPDARKWFAEQPTETQRQILGPGRLGLLNSGAITWDDIPQQRPNANWRMSYAPRSLGSLQKIAKANARR